MNVSRSKIEHRLRIRILGWQLEIANKAGDKLKRRLQEGTTVESDVLFRKPPADFKPLNNWDKFEQRYDGLKNSFWRRDSEPDEEVLIFLLDGVPEDIIPFICHVWFERMVKGFCETGETRTQRIPCHLTVFDRKEVALFDHCCADAPALFRYLEALRSFTLEAPILLDGPTGTGKTYFARFLHRMTRKDEEFKRVNLGSLSQEPDKFESMMVGHIKGAFTGADKETEGYLVECQNGTLFLDELDGLSIPNQILLLSYTDDVRQDGTMTVRKYGSGAKDKVIARPNMVFATNRSVSQALREGRLRSDFLYRFDNTVRFDSLEEIFNQKPGEKALERDARVAIHLWFFLMKRRPFLTDCPERFWKECPSMLWRPDDPVFKLLTKFHWPGNLRTLEKYCRHLIDVDAFNPLFDWVGDWGRWERQFNDSEDAVSISEERAPHFPAGTEKLREDIRIRYRDLILMALDGSTDEGGKHRTTEASEVLGITTRTLKKKMAAFGLT